MNKEERCATVYALMGEAPQYHLYRPVDSWEVESYRRKKRNFLENHPQYKELLGDTEETPTFGLKDCIEILHEIIDWI